MTERVVWLVNHHAGVVGRPGGTRQYWLSRGLASRGWSSHVIASGAAKGTGIGEERSGHRLEGGVSYTWLDGPGYSGNGASRMWSYSRFTQQVLARRSLRHLPPPDVVIGSSVHPFAAWAGLRLARRHSVPFIFEIRDLWPETLVQTQALARDSAAARALWRLEGHLVRCSTVVMSPLPLVGGYLDERYSFPKERFVWISNGFSSVQHPEPVASRESSDTFTFMYFGALGEVNEIPLMLEALELARRSAPQIRLSITGSGRWADEITRGQAANRWQGVTLNKAIPPDQVGAAMSAGSALIYAVPDLPQLYKYGVSANKIFDYLASGLPAVVAANFPRNPFEEADSALVVPPGDASALARAMVTMSSMPPEQRAALGSRGREAAGSYEYDALSGRLGQVLDLVATGLDRPRTD